VSECVQEREDFSVRDEIGSFEIWYKRVEFLTQITSVHVNIVEHTQASKGKITFFKGLLKSTIL